MRSVSARSIVMTKRLHPEEALDDIETFSFNSADAIVESVASRIRSTPNWIRLQQNIEQLWSQYMTKVVERRMLLYRFPGGSKTGKRIVKRDFEAAYQTVMHQYFDENPLYSNKMFDRRFRVSKKIFERVYNACLKHPSFQHNKNAAGRFGIHPLVKTTACFRHIGYGTAADQLDEYFQIAETTFCETRLAFVDVGLFIFCECLFFDVHILLQIAIFITRSYFTSSRKNTYRRLTSSWQDRCAKHTKRLVGQGFSGPWTVLIGSGRNAQYLSMESIKKGVRRCVLWCMSARVIISFAYGTATLHCQGQATTSMYDQSPSPSFPLKCYLTLTFCFFDRMS